MPRQRLDLEKIETRMLAPYAQSSAGSRGRVREEEPHLFRTAFQRDRDRIVHSRSFRRLELKTQVFLNGSGDHYRTRMTHTMEVSCIARTMARALGLSEDLAEAIALAHDLGHPPFGHLGETTLHDLMSDHGGFRHNQQSLRVVEELELKYPEFNGLNLSWEVREGLQKPYLAGKLGEGFQQPSLEAQVVDLSDQLAYICHDLDDGLDSGLIREADLPELALWRTLQAETAAAYPHLEAERNRNYILRTMLGRLADDAIVHSSDRIQQYAPTTSDQVRRLPKMVTLSPEIQDQARAVLRFLFERLYHHPQIDAINAQSAACLSGLFHLFLKNPHLLSPQFSLRVKKDGLHRAACDYLACLSDRQAYALYKKWLGPIPPLEGVRLAQPALFEVP